MTVLDTAVANAALLITMCTECRDAMAQLAPTAQFDVVYLRRIATKRLLDLPAWHATHAGVPGRNREVIGYVLIAGLTHRHGGNGWREHSHIGGDMPHEHDRETDASVALA